MNKETIASIIKWHEDTFKDATLEGQIEKYKTEVAEWYRSGRRDTMELADMAICACGIARFSIIDALYYTVCTGCNKYNIYEFCGLTRDKSVNNWNIANIPFAKTSENMSRGV